jgi:hypothetical protein
VLVLKLIAVGLGLVGLVIAAKRWASAVPAVAKHEPEPPHATFEGGSRYLLEHEREPADDGDLSGHGEGVLTAIVDVLRARGLGTNPVEPLSYGYMTVVEIDGEDVILDIGVADFCDDGEPEWKLFVKARDHQVPRQIREALAALAGIRNVQWVDGDAV